jgi:transcriptional antiterminator RfaH
MGMGNWAVAVTRPNQEIRVEGYLTRQGFGVYAPKIRERLAIGGRFCYRQAPLFPRYVFVAGAHAWEAVARTFGVVGLVYGASDKPALVSSEVVEELQLRHDRDGFIQLPRFRSGEKVRITSGPFAGRLALYQGMVARQRESVLLAALGRLDLTIGSLEAA